MGRLILRYLFILYNQLTLSAIYHLIQENLEFQSNWQSKFGVSIPWTRAESQVWINLGCFRLPYEFLSPSNFSNFHFQPFIMILTWCFTVKNRCNPAFFFTEHVDVSKRLLTLFLIISTSDPTDLICLNFSVHSVHLYYLFPSLEEGGLATYRTAIVQNQHLAMLAKVNPPSAGNECAGQSSGRSASWQEDMCETVLLFSVLLLWLCLFLRGRWGKH